MNRSLSSPPGIGDRQLVSVIIPAFNASSTLPATLESAIGQTHENIEIIVVNDGSTDGTQAVAERYARQDPRIRIVSTPNRGVAAARNTGIDETRSELVAPLDADDLWHPEKIARQLEALDGGGPKMGFVYAGSRIVDVNGEVRISPPLKLCEGRAFLRSVFVNLVGNGSALLARRQALQAAGGYSEELRRRGLEGTEDRLVQTLIARRWTIGVVPAYLVGYRQLPTAMSADRVRMYRSQRAILQILASRYPDIPRWVLDAAKALVETNLAINQLKARFDPLKVSATFFRAFRHSPETAARETLARLQSEVLRRARNLWRSGGTRSSGVGAGIDFFELSPEDGVSPRMRHRLGWMLERIAREEEEAFAARSRQPERVRAGQHEVS